jgi:predicted GNAT family N-acyltransferase
LSRICREAPHGGEQYADMVQLRDAVLRKPLGLAFSSEELAAESDSIHLGCWQDDELVGCLILKPDADGRVRMRQVAVKTEQQGRGIGRVLVVFCEELARARGFREMVLHARETALPFYAKLGYATEGQRFVEVGLPHFQMRKVLTSR